MILAEYFPAETSTKLVDLACALFFLVMTVYFMYGYHSKNVEPLNFSKLDKFDIGYIRDDEPNLPHVSIQLDNDQDELKKLKRQVEIQKLKRQLDQFKSEPAKSKLKHKKLNEGLTRDCEDVLVSLGVHKRKAKAEVEIILENNPDIKTPQEFITEYGKKCA